MSIRNAIAKGFNISTNKPLMYLLHPNRTVQAFLSARKLLLSVDTFQHNYLLVFDSPWFGVSEWQFAIGGR